MSRKNLNSLYARFVGETTLAQQAFHAIIPALPLTEIDCLVAHAYASEMAVIRIQDAWSRFCRELVLVSAFGFPRTATGTIVQRAPGIMTRHDAIARINVIYHRNPGQEPDWHQPHASINAARALGIRNFPNVSAGIGATPSPLTDLRDFRNFFAHRTQRLAISTKTIARASAISERLLARDIIAEEVGPGVSLLTRWVAQIQNLAYASIQ